MILWWVSLNIIFKYTLQRAMPYLVFFICSFRFQNPQIRALVRHLLVLELCLTPFAVFCGITMYAEICVYTLKKKLTHLSVSWDCKLKRQD